MNTRLATLSLLALTSSACSVGMNAARHPHATTPAGATAAASILPGSTCSGCSDLIVGELLAASDSGVLILAEPRTVYFVHYGTIRRLQVHGLRPMSQPASGQPRDNLRFASRYPAGMSATVLRSLLSISTPDSVIVAR